ncbi:helix-turn-helix domain-containing protein [Deinococcus cellulosilyticus]|uniref:HTH cro/C1-type domain-containing protein n=1 Tax=Deinococcus cellulosilyticus (strain DSM 18568 / NBRC 106333 / KACC 11606 / 5516J-15) TaxID=1223518 RepID=A0A511N3Y8_DEIC1|nr:helix-turn-helix transcriptional regulator [Deinococcus cellulosilyticus]GEM47178.1 hypothetical protein DC3_28130 [Deinococcus cellulosilyticus NBRC 106333 = KACC 11606]
MTKLLQGLQPLRQARKLTQEELAKKAGVSVETIRKHEQGAYDGISGDTLNKLAGALGCPSAFLFLPYNSDVSENQESA